MSANPDSNPVPNCMVNLNDFPKRIRSAVGTTFGKLQAKLILHTEGSVSCDTQNILHLSQRVGSVNHGTCLLKAKLDVDFFLFKEMFPLSVEADKMEVSATSAGNMMEQSG